MQGFRKNTASPSGEDDFSTEPEGLDLACTKEHELPLPVSYGDSATGVLSVWIIS